MQVPLRRSIRERRSTIPTNYIVYSKGHMNINGIENDIVNLYKAINSSNSQKWVEAI